jgi:transcriptional regulator with XRE-family HTH domain
MTIPARSIGELLREWRQRRRLSQLDLACRADISTKHLSFVETGRAAPSRDMVLHLAECLLVPLRERNRLLTAAGFAPEYQDRPLDDPARGAAREAVDLVISGHEPYPALAMDRHWTIVASNAAVARLLNSVDPALLHPPVNALRLGLHPAGLAPRIANLPEWRAHLLARLHHQIDVTADPVLEKLEHELREYPVPDRAETVPPVALDTSFIIPLRLSTAGGVLNLFNTTTVFGTSVDVTLAELVLECFYPADPATAEALRAAAASR